MKDNPTDTLDILAHLIAVLLAALFVVTALIGLILFNVERRAFDPAAYQRALVRQNFYRQFPALLGDLLVRDAGGSMPAFLGHLSANQWKALIDAMLPEEQLQAMTEDTLDQFFAYLNGQTDTPRISLLLLKNGLAGSVGLNAVLTIVQSQPDCTVQEIIRILSSFGQEICNPPQQILELLHPIIQSQLQVAASVLPDSISLLPTAMNPAILPTVKGLRAIRLLMRLSPLVPIGLLLVITLIVVRTFKGWLVWWGWPFFLTGLSGMPLGFAGAPLFRWAIERWLSQRITLTFTPEISASIRSVLDATLREILKPAAWESLALFILGLAMILTSAYLTYREKKHQRTSAPHIWVR
jgi:hypothetical protein